MAHRQENSSSSRTNQVNQPSQQRYCDYSNPQGQRWRMDQRESRGGMDFRHQTREYPSHDFNRLNHAHSTWQHPWFPPQPISPNFFSMTTRTYDAERRQSAISESGDQRASNELGGSKRRLPEDFVDVTAAKKVALQTAERQSLIAAQYWNKRLNEQAFELQQRLNDLQEENSNKTKENEELKQRLQQTEAGNEALRQEVWNFEELKQRLKEAEQKLRDRDEAVLKYYNEAVRARKELKQIHGQRCEAVHERNKFELRCAQAELRSRQHEKELADYKRAERTDKSNIRELEQKLRKALEAKEREPRNV